MTITSAGGIVVHESFQRCKAERRHEVFVSRELMGDCLFPDEHLMGECLTSECIGGGFFLPVNLRKMRGWADG